MTYYERTCLKWHRSSATREAMKEVASSQADYWRHKCAACACARGVADGIRKAAEELMKIAAAKQR